MVRRLTAQEQALWARVAASIRPLPGRRAPAPVPATLAAPAPTPAAKARPAVPASPQPATRPPPPPVHVATLDGAWDKRIRRGRLEPDLVIDLHGHSVAEAHGRLAAAITAGDGAQVLLVITGKGRHDRPGRIRSELLHWLERPDWRPLVAAVRGAHPRHGGSGAFYVILRRQR